MKITKWKPKYESVKLITLSGEEVERVIKKYAIDNKLIDSNIKEYHCWIEYQLNHNGGIVGYDICTYKEIK